MEPLCDPPRDPGDAADGYAGLTGARCVLLGPRLFGVEVRHEGDLLRVFAEFRPRAVTNAIGIVEQRDEAKAALPSLNVVFL